MKHFQLAFLLMMQSCFGTAPTKEQIKTPDNKASGKNFKLAVRICKQYGGVAFVVPGEKFKAECRDGLKISRDKEEQQNSKSER